MAIGKTVFFFKKLRLFYIEIRINIFFKSIILTKMIENKRFENSIIQWVYEVVKEAFKKSEKIRVVFF